MKRLAGTIFLYEKENDHASNSADSINRNSFSSFVKFPQVSPSWKPQKYSQCPFSFPFHVGLEGCSYFGNLHKELQPPL